MELASQEILDALRPGVLPRPRKPGPRMARAKEDAVRYHAKSRRCRCGICAACIENARWERIFQEKFADPDYYAHSRLPGHGSSLNW